MISLFKNKIIILLLILTILLSLSWFVNLSYSFPKVKSFSPANGATGILVSQTIKIEFEKNIDKNLLEISISPFQEYDLNINKNLLEIKPKPSLKIGTTYLISAKHRPTRKEIVSFQFSTKPPQGSPETSEEAEKITKNYYPLASYSPPENGKFYFKYTDRLKLTVYLLKDKEAAKKEFEEWAKSKGVNLSTHQITYITSP